MSKKVTATPRKKRGFLYWLRLLGFGLLGGFLLTCILVEIAYIADAVKPAPGSVGDLPAAVDWRAYQTQIEGAVLASHHVCQAVLPHFRQRAQGSIINLVTEHVASNMWYPLQVVSTVMACNGPTAASLAASNCTTPAFDHWVQCLRVLWRKGEQNRGTSFFWRSRPLSPVDT